MPPALSVRIQDDGVKYPCDGSFLDCDYDNNSRTINGLLAFRDDIYTTGEVTFPPLDNDLPGTCTLDALTAFDILNIVGLKHGAVTINPDKSFTYIPVAGYTGTDSIMYYIKCGTDASWATVYIWITPKDTLCTTDPNYALTASYTDDGRFGNTLSWRWEHSETGFPESTWTEVDSGASTDGTITATTPLPDHASMQTGFYRMIVSTPAGIDNPQTRYVNDARYHLFSPCALPVNPHLRIRFVK
jgi:hypothetical protein